MRIHTIRSIVMLVSAIAAIIMPSMASAQQANHAGVIIQRESLTNIVRDCSSIYPLLAPTLQAQLDAWHAERADASTAADAFIAGLTPDERTTMDKLTRTARQSATDMLTAAQRLGDGEEFCTGSIESFGTLNSQGHFDADNMNEAVGMYQIAISAAEIAREICVARYPGLASYADEALAEWRKRDALIAATVQSHMSDMRRENPSAVKDMEDSMNRNIREMLMTGIDSGNESYCRKHFDDLAAGKKRRTTPKMYQYLERESSAP